MSVDPGWRQWPGSGQSVLEPDTGEVSGVPCRSTSRLPEGRLGAVVNSLVVGQTVAFSLGIHAFRSPDSLTVRPRLHLTEVLLRNLLQLSAFLCDPFFVGRSWWATLSQDWTTFRKLNGADVAKCPGECTFDAC